MSDYPERINISPVHRRKREDDFYLVDRAAFPGKGTEYIRADHAQAEKEAAVAAEREAWKKQPNRHAYKIGVIAGKAMNERCARSDTDALERVRQEAKAEALREATHLMPRHYGVWSSTGVHIGTWDDGAIAAKVLGEYPGGVMRDLIDMDAILELIPDQHKEDE